MTGEHTYPEPKDYQSHQAWRLPKSEGPRLVIRLNSDAKMSRGKAAAAAVHAALMALDVHPGGPVIVLGAKRSEVESLRTVVHDAGRTEVEPGTATAGTDFDPSIELTPRV